MLEGIARWAFAVLLAALPAPVRAQTTEPPKTLTLYIGAPAGSTYDLYGRVMARHLGHHLPGNPTVIVSNMLGAGSLACANFIYNVAPRDGSALAMVVQNIAEEQVLGSEGIRYDAAKFGWVGRLASNLEVAYLWHTVPVDGVDDLKRRETIFAASGSSTIIYPLLLNNILGTRIKLVRGYSGTPTAHLAMERGEVEGTLGSLSGLRALVPEWFATGKVKMLLQFRQGRHPDLANVPTIMEVMPTEEDKQLFGFFISSATVGRSLLAPPGLTPARTAALRAAFDATVRDPQFQADAAQAHIELEPLPGTAIQDTVERQVGAAGSIRERILAVRWRQ